MIQAPSLRRRIKRPVSNVSNTSCSRQTDTSTQYVCWSSCKNCKERVFRSTWLICLDFKMVQVCSIFAVVRGISNKANIYSQRATTRFFSAGASTAVWTREQTGRDSNQIVQTKQHVYGSFPYCSFPPTQTVFSWYFSGFQLPTVSNLELRKCAPLNQSPCMWSPTPPPKHLSSLQVPSQRHNGQCSSTGNPGFVRLAGWQFVLESTGCVLCGFCCQGCIHWIQRGHILNISHLKYVYRIFIYRTLAFFLVFVHVLFLPGSQ